MLISAAMSTEPTIGAAVLLGRLQAPQARRPRLGLQRRGRSADREIARRDLRLLDLPYERSDLLAHELAHRLENHPLFVAQPKVHAWSLVHYTLLLSLLNRAVGA